MLHLIKIVLPLHSKRKDVIKKINGYGDKYSISIDGDVISHFHRQRKLEKKLTPTYCKRTGYYRVKLTHLGKSTTISLHRLIALYFIPNPDNKKTVNHKNGIKTDNRLENLEWMTYSENEKHAYDTGIKNKYCNKNSKYYTPKSSDVGALNNS